MLPTKRCAGRVAVAARLAVPIPKAVGGHAGPFQHCCKLTKRAVSKSLMPLREPSLQNRVAAMGNVDS